MLFLGSSIQDVSAWVGMVRHGGQQSLLPANLVMGGAATSNHCRAKYPSCLGTIELDLQGRVADIQG